MVHTVDLRQELKTGNRSILSGLLQEKLTKVLQEHRQAMAVSEPARVFRICILPVVRRGNALSAL